MIKIASGSFLVVVALLAHGVVAAEQGAVPGTARIAGRVTRADTGAPIPDAAIQLQAPAGRARSARADAEGRFAFTDLEAGRYVVLATADGFLNLDATVTRPSGAGRPIEVKDAEAFERADVAMAPPRAIEGRVLDPSGQPAPGVTVQIAQLMYAAGRSRLMPGGATKNTGPTDDRGHFRIYGLPPGDYYVLALSGPFGRSGPSAFSSAGDGLPGFAPTYFPGTERAADAQPVRLGLEHDALDVTFTLAGARMAAVSGRVTDVSGRPVAHANLMLLQTQGGDIRAIVPANTVSDADGAFAYRNVPPGTYVLQAFAQSAFGVSPVNVARTEAAADVAGVTVTMRPLVTARGRVTFDGDAPPAPGSVSVGFMPTDFVSGPIGGNRIPSHVNADWSFEIGQLASTGVVRAAGPGPWRLKSVSRDGKDITDTPTDFQTGDVTGLEVVLTSHVGSIGGNVLDGDKPAADCAVIVFPEDRAAWAFPTRLVSATSATSSGGFKFGGILPGRYLVVALPEPPPQIDEAWLSTIRSWATPLAVTEGQTATQTMKLTRR